MAARICGKGGNSKIQSSFNVQQGSTNVSETAVKVGQCLRHCIPRWTAHDLSHLLSRSFAPSTCEPFVLIISICFEFTERCDSSSLTCNAEGETFALFSYRSSECLGVTENVSQGGRTTVLFRAITNCKSKTKMPVKIGFQVVASTGEDERFRVTELNYHGPTARGWRSSMNCTFPQEIILQLKVLAILQQIQILAHQYLIPQKIEICTSSKLEQGALANNSRDLFEYLGFITFSDNQATGFRSRELKSILIPSKKAKYIKLRIHNNHVNVKNVYNQVGLMAVNILGNELHGRTDENETNNNITFQTTASHTSDLPYGSNYLSPYDDLAFQMSVDEETARIIKVIEGKMLQAVFDDRLDYANSLKITLENLRAAGEILGIYEQEKRRAINLEDFDRAKLKKVQIDNFRDRIYTTLRIEQLLDETDFVEEMNDLNSNHEEKSSLESTPVQNSPRRDLNGRALTPNENVQTFHPEVFRPNAPQTYSNQLIHSQSQTFPDPHFQTPAFSTSISNPHLYQYLKQTHATIPEPTHKSEVPPEPIRTPSSVSDSLTGDEFSPPKTPQKYPPACTRWNGSLIPRRDKRTESKNPSAPKNWTESRSPPPLDWAARNKLKTSVSEQKIRSKTVTTTTMKSSFEAYEDRMLPALRSYHGNEVVRECQLAFGQQRKSTLNEREKKQAMVPISVFGIEMIEKFYSKSFNDKEEGLKQLQQELKKLVIPAEENGESKHPPYNKISRAAIFLLHRGLRDTVYSVYKLAAETVRLFFAEFVPQRVSPSEVARSVEKLLPELLTKSGDVTPRIHNLAAHTLLSMAECEEVRRLNIIPAHLSRPLTSSVHPRLALSRLEMVEQLILNHGISKDKKSGLTCRTLAEFGSSGLHHPAEAVRKVSERILIHVYKVNPRIVRKQLPPDDNVTRRNLLYRQLFQEFDFMDVQRKLNEQSLDDSMTAFETDHICPPQHQTDAQSKTNRNFINEHFPEEMKSKSIPKLGLNPPLEPAKPFLPMKVDKERTQTEMPPQRKHQETKKRQTVTPPGKKEEKSVKCSSNGDATLKFPSLTDSIRTTKARMLLEQERVARSNRMDQQNGNSLPSNSITRKENRRDGPPSGIPVANFGASKLPTSIKAQKQKQNQTTRQQVKPNEALSRTKLFNKTIKIRLFDSVEDTISEVNENSLLKNEEEESGMEESMKFSDSMLASIRENEFTMGGLFNGRKDEEEKLKMCIFCLSPEKWTNEDSLNRHYLKDCLMLTSCEYCMEVTEISGFTNHLLDDCKWKNLFQKCKNCHEAILRDLYDKHECTAAAGKAHKSRCPFCHKTIGAGETSWRKHLTGKNTCPNHPRQK